MAQTETVESAADKIVSTAMRLGITMVTEFVPFSKSRNAKEKSPSLNWKVTLTAGDGRELLTTDYSAGCGDCPAYKASIKRMGSHNSVMRHEAIKFECETGREAVVMEGINFTGRGKELQPKIEDVLYSLCADSDVIDCGSFEEWASNFGYETDSRKAEKIYRECLSIALKLRNGLGEEGLAQLREACQDY